MRVQKGIDPRHPRISHREAPTAAPSAAASTAAVGSPHLNLHRVGGCVAARCFDLQGIGGECGDGGELRRGGVATHFNVAYI